MKNKIAWVIDSVSYVSDEFLAHPDVYVAPLTINFGNEQYVDGENLTTEELYHKINTTKAVPTTSQPSTGSFEALYKELAAKGYDCAIAVHISSELSGTIASSTAGASLVPEFPVHIIDSLSMSYGISYIVERGIQLHEEGKALADILTVMKRLVGKLQNYILIGKLDQLYKGGRMGGVQYFLGSLLKVKPIVQLSADGHLFPFDKVRSEKKAFQYLVDRVREKENQIQSVLYIMHGNIESRAKQLKEAILEKSPHLTVKIGDISSTIAVHAGEETLAILWFEEEGTES